MDYAGVQARDCAGCTADGPGKGAAAAGRPPGRPPGTPPGRPPRVNPPRRACGRGCADRGERARRCRSPSGLGEQGSACEGSLRSSTWFLACSSPPSMATTRSQLRLRCALGGCGDSAVAADPARCQHAPQSRAALEGALGAASLRATSRRGAHIVFGGVSDRCSAVGDRISPPSMAAEHRGAILSTQTGRRYTGMGS